MVLRLILVILWMWCSEAYGRSGDFYDALLALKIPAATQHRKGVVTLRCGDIQCFNKSISGIRGLMIRFPDTELIVLTDTQHAEYVEVSNEVVSQIKRTKANGGRVIAVGTTSVRSLESAAKSSENNGTELSEFYGDTDIFITPGYEFKLVDALLTNFHLSESTLLMLVSAFAGYEHIMSAYQHAINEKYRFFSYGDAMFLTKKES